MAISDQFGTRLGLSIRGTSHAPRMTFRLENFPAGVAVDEAKLAAFMERRAPGRDDLSTSRREPDRVEFEHGVRNGVTTGETITGFIASTNQRPRDYGNERTVPRPGHADFGQWVESGRIPTGGGKNSGRLTAPVCAAGGLCLQYLERRGIRVTARVEAINGNRKDPDGEIRAAKERQDSVGGTIVCEATGFPAGLGGALFGGIETELAGGLFGIPGVKGVEFGEGFACTTMTGSEFNDAFSVRDGVVTTRTNRQGGILGGRSSGMPIVFRVALRPTPTVFKPQASVDLATMTDAVCEMKGRHDPCIVRRAVPVVEAVAAYVLTDVLLAAEAASSRICLTLTGATLEEDVAQYRSQRYFTDMVELRVDLLKKKERTKNLLARFRAQLPHVPVIVTFRKTVDGGAFAGREEERLSFFRKLLAAESAEPSADGLVHVDFEEGFGDDSLVALARQAGAKVVRSMHSFSGPVKNLPARLRALGKAGDVAKIAFMPKAQRDVDRLFAQLSPAAAGLPGRRSLPPHVVCAMGPLGLQTRVLAGRLGSLWTYASVGGLGKIGHVTPYDLVRTYRLRSVTSQAEVVRVPPDEVEQINARFAACDEDAVALPLVD